MVIRIKVPALYFLDAQKVAKARCVEQLPMHEDERLARKVPDENFISDIRQACKVVSNIDAEAVAPEFPQLDDREEG